MRKKEERRKSKEEVEDHDLNGYAGEGGLAGPVG